MLDQHSLDAGTLKLALSDADIEVISNSAPLLEELRRYFAHIVTDKIADPIRVVAIESSPVVLDLEWRDWSREPGKTGRKDSCFDLDNARLIRKVRTGMLFLQSETNRIAIGPCLKNSNQVINFINNQYMNRLQQQGWLNCHAAALTRAEQGMAQRFATLRISWVFLSIIKLQH